MKEKGFIQIDSSMINAYRYSNNALYIEFSNGDVYVYQEVPKDVYKELIKGSFGSNFHRLIKDKYTNFLYKG